jgi:hypothetical protein
MLVSTYVVSKYGTQATNPCNGSLSAKGKVMTQVLELGRSILRTCQLDLQ